MEKLEKKEANATICKPLARSLIKGIKKRFSGDLADPKLVMSSVLIPRFKLSWISNAEDRLAATTDLNKAIERECLNMEISDKAVGKEDDSDDEDGILPKKPRLDKSDLSEAEQYLQDPSKDLASVKKFPTISKLFVQLNTMLPSSAPVERLFSVGGGILCSNRNSLRDDRFEMALMLKVNKFSTL